MSKSGRSDLKNAFLKGKIPKEKDFHDLIDSSINSVDDGIIKDKGKGVKILSSGINHEIMSFFNNIKDITPAWEVNLRSEDGDEGFNIHEPNSGSKLFIEKGGNVGIGSTKPNSKLDVQGVVSSHGRKGFFAFGNVPADGKWHEVVSDLDEYNIFEITASTGKKGSHAIIHAIAVATYGNSKPAITKTSGRYGSFRNSIDIRWGGSYFSYNLQIRTKKDYGDDINISYNISKLL